MSDLIPWYLVELRSRLSPFLDAKLVETIVGETKSHLNESVSRLESEQGVGEDQATSTAVGAYGSPEKVALSHLKEHAWRPFGIKPIWLVVGGAFTATTCWMLHWQWLGGYWDNYGATWENGLALFVCFFAIVEFAVGCYAGRRRFRAVTLAAGLAMMLGLPFLYSFLLVGSDMHHQALNRLFLSRDVQKEQRTLGWVNRLDGYLANGEQVFANAKNPSDIPSEYTDDVDAIRAIGGFPNRGRAIAARFNEITINPNFDSIGRMGGPGAILAKAFVVPIEHGNVDTYVDSRLYTGLEDVSDFSHAVLFWRTRTAELRKNLGIERTRMSAMLASAAEARNGRLFFFDPVKYGDQVMGSIPTALIFLLIVEAGVFARLRSRRRRPEYASA